MNECRNVEPSMIVAARPTPSNEQTLYTNILKPCISSLIRIWIFLQTNHRLRLISLCSSPVAAGSRCDRYHRPSLNEPLQFHPSPEQEPCVVVDTAAGTVAGMAVDIVAGKGAHRGCVRCLRIGRKTGVAQSERTEASTSGTGQARTCRFDEDPPGRVIRCMFLESVST